MTDNRNQYSVSDLAAELQVPRTTVNDWLKKFDRYIDFEMRGRRKVYTDSSLEVLKLISAARDKGTPLPDLEQELSGRCAVRPEISPLSESTEAESCPPPQENLPALNYDFSNLLKEMEMRETRRNTAGKRSFILVSVLLVLLLGVGCATLMLLGQLLTLKESSKTLDTRLAAAKEESALLRKNTEKELKIIAAKVEKSELSGTRAAEKLQNRLADQRKQFNHVLGKLEQAEKRRAQELVKLEKENFRLKAELDAAARILSQKQNACTEAEKKIASLKAENAKLKKEKTLLEQKIQKIEKAQKAEKTVPPAAPAETAETKAK